MFSLKKYGLIILLTTLTSMLWSCKENTILPSDLVPVVDNINTFDTTFDLVTHTLYQDSFLTGGYRSGLQLSSSSTYYTPCGTILSDPAFGKTVASFHVELLPAVPGFSFKAKTSDVMMDSVVLSIPFKMAYGDTNATAGLQTFKLFRSIKTGTSLSRDSAQYEFTRDSFDTGNLLSTLSVNFDQISADSPLIAGVRQQPQLRFRLPAWFADSIKAQIDSGANGAMANYSKFLSWWKGFAIVPDSSQGKTLGYFDSYRTRLTFYYRYPKTGGGEDTVNDVFSFDPYYCNRFASITHNYTGSLSGPFIHTHQPGGDSLLFLQNEPGLVNVIGIPSAYLMPNVIVNRAQLVFTGAPLQNWSDTLSYSPLARLQIFKCDSTGENDKVADDYAQFNSSAYVDGKRTTVQIGGQFYPRYTFTVTYSLQRLISQKDSTFRFKIMGANLGYPAAYRSILCGSGSLQTDFKPRLEMIFTKIKKY